MAVNLEHVLTQELIRLEGIHGQDPETGQNVGTDTTYIGKYTNRIFGAPYQFLDSVDRRFSSVNPHVGNEYLRNIILHSPILHIKPGLPKYTGGTDGNSIFNGIKSIYLNTTSGNMTFTESLLETLASSTLFSKGSKLQKRMFGFRETYYQFMSHVNYMCHSMAIFLQLTDTTHEWPNGCFTSTNGSLQSFSKIGWENYRMLDGSTVTSPLDQLIDMGGATLLGATLASGKDVLDYIAGSAADIVTSILTNPGTKIDPTDAANAFSEVLQSGVSADEILASAGTSTSTETTTESSRFDQMSSSVADNYANAMDTSLTDVMVDKICSVQFMVDPSSFEETLTNETTQSAIEQTLGAISTSVGHEIAFITGSNVDMGLLENITDFLGDTLTTAANFLSGLVTPLAGGFGTNLIQGALGSITGQRMIYPQIYQSSSASRSYQMTINLVSPYGDVYNYYMNIIVPLMHLIALAAPRMVTANSVQSPYLVQAFIPGLCTCQLGIIENLQIVKNKSQHAVSVNGFPLEVQVNLTIKELYTDLSISPANDPASFLFNETLNDYMANLAGMMPSVDTYTKQRAMMFQNLESYFTSGAIVNDFANSLLTGVEDFINPFTQ